MGIFVRHCLNHQQFEANDLIIAGSIVALSNDVHTGEVGLYHADRATHLEEVVGIAGDNSGYREGRLVGVSGDNLPIFAVEVDNLEWYEDVPPPRISVHQGRITVFALGGEFKTDQYVSDLSAVGTGDLAIDIFSPLLPTIGTHLSVGIRDNAGKIMRNNNSRLHVGNVLGELEFGTHLPFRLNIQVLPGTSTMVPRTFSMVQQEPHFPEKVERNEINYKYKDQNQSDDEDYPILVEL